MTARIAIVVAVLGAALCGPARPARAEGTADWLKRILDPATIGVTPFPGSKLNKKITVDTIRYEDPSKRIAVYMAPLPELPKAVEYFTTTLGVKPTKEVDTFVFGLRGAGTYPPAAKGLVVTIQRSPWVDGMAQIQLTLTIGP